jgi:hypothetical protein
MPVIKWPASIGPLKQIAGVNNNDIKIDKKKEGVAILLLLLQCTYCNLT